MEKELYSVTIGKLADALNINIETVRYYQREGLIKEPAKRNNGYRYYGIEHFSKILFIKRAKELGFTLSEIKDFLNLNTQKKATCSIVTTRVDEKINEIDKKINDLNIIKASLKKLRGACDIGDDEMKKVNIIDCFINDCKC